MKKAISGDLTLEKEEVGFIGAPTEVVVWTPPAPTEDAPTEDTPSSSRSKMKKAISGDLTLEKEEVFIEAPTEVVVWTPAAPTEDTPSSSRSNEEVMNTEVLVAQQQKDFDILPLNLMHIIISRCSYRTFERLMLASREWYFDYLDSISKQKVLIPCNPIHSIDLSNYSFVDHPRSPIVNGDTSIIIVGSLDCSAILMVDNTLKSSPILFLYNPFTKNIFQIPRQPTCYHENILDLDTVAYGFGFSDYPHYHDPRIVVLSQYGPSHSFSFKTQTWKRIKFNKRDVSITSLHATFVIKTRKLYWIAKKSFRHGDIVNIALCLNLDTMCFHEIIFGSALPLHTLGTFKGDLCALVFVKRKEQEDEDWTEWEDEDDEEALDDGQLWWSTTDEVGFYQIRVLKSNRWSIIHTTTLSDQQGYGKFYVMTFLDCGRILFKVFNKQENQDSTLHIYNIHETSTVNLTVPPTLHVGNCHAAQYHDSVVGLATLSFEVPAISLDDDDSYASSSSDSPSSIIDHCPDNEIDFYDKIGFWNEYDWLEGLAAGCFSDAMDSPTTNE